MIEANAYIDLSGRHIRLDRLSDDERALVECLEGRAKGRPDWSDFENYWTKAVAEFYEPQGLTRSQIRKTSVYRIAQDLGSRLAVDSGLARTPDYRDELEELIRTRFKTRREFCRAAGLSEDMLSHVLAHRKHIGIETLSTALSRVGYHLRIVPIEESAGSRGTESA